MDPLLGLLPGAEEHPPATRGATRSTCRTIMLESSVKAPVFLSSTPAHLRRWRLARQLGHGVSSPLLGLSAKVVRLLPEDRGCGHTPPSGTTFTTSFALGVAQLDSVSLELSV